VDAQQWAEALSLAHGIESDVLARAAALHIPGGAALSKSARFAALPPALQRELASAKALVAHTHLTHAEWLAVMDRYEEAQVRGEAPAVCRLFFSHAKMLHAG
jgi:hypothetical protein